MQANKSNYSLISTKVIILFGSLVNYYYFCSVKLKYKIEEAALCQDIHERKAVRASIM
jgi:hypothetical protein